MEHVLPDERRVAVVLELLRLGYPDRMVLSHDAASFSRVTPDDIDAMLVAIPARLLVPERPPGS